MEHTITLDGTRTINELVKMLRKIRFRGLYDKYGENLFPYERVLFKRGTVYPAKNLGESPVLKINDEILKLYSAQPTIYQNQIEIMRSVDEFLMRHDLKLTKLNNPVNYTWGGRGKFHILPPIIEKQTYFLNKGFINLNKINDRFRNKFVKDAVGNLHELSNRYLINYFIDEVSKLDHLDMFNSNAPLLNYGLQFSGKHDFYLICDGIHRIDYAIETLNEPINVLVVESETEEALIPYYAFPVHFRPSLRLSSKRSERMYPRLERDKIHLLNDFIKKILHYDWTAGGLNVSSLRSQSEIF